MKDHLLYKLNQFNSAGRAKAWPNCVCNPFLATAIDCDATKGGTMARTKATAIAGHAAKAKAKAKAPAAPKKAKKPLVQKGNKKKGTHAAERSAADDNQEEEEDEEEEDEEEEEPALVGDASKPGRHKILFASACWLDFYDCLNIVIRIRLEKKWLLQVAKRFFNPLAAEEREEERSDDILSKSMRLILCG